jgi:hypothetical protein
MSRFRSSKRAKELKRKAHKKVKEERKREREKSSEDRAPDDDIDWSLAVGSLLPETSDAEGVEGAEDAEDREDAETEDGEVSDLAASEGDDDPVAPDPGPPPAEQRDPDPTRES